MSEKCVHEWYYRIVDIVSWQFFCIRCGEKLSMDKFSDRATELEKNADALNARIAELEYQLEDWTNNGWAEDYKARIAELEEAQRWIPVSERLPDFGSPILFYDSILERINKGTCTAMNSDNTNLHWFTDDDLFYFGDRSEYITHWMPLPQPPEVQE